MSSGFSTFGSHSRGAGEGVLGASWGPGTCSQPEGPSALPREPPRHRGLPSGAGPIEGTPGVLFKPSPQGTHGTKPHSQSPLVLAHRLADARCPSALPEGRGFVLHGRDVNT